MVHTLLGVMSNHFYDGDDDDGGPNSTYNHLTSRPVYCPYLGAGAGSRHLTLRHRDVSQP